MFIILNNSTRKILSKPNNIIKLISKGGMVELKGFFPKVIDKNCDVVF